MVGFVIEASSGGHAQLNVSFDKLCADTEYHIPKYISHYQASYKVFFAQWKYISVGDKYCARDTFLNQLEVSASTSTQKDYAKLKATWLSNVLFNYKFYLKQKLEACDKDTSLPCGLACYNLSILDTKQDSFYVFVKVTPSLRTASLLKKQCDPGWLTYLQYQCVAKNKVQLLSWQNSSEICEQIGGSLPVFTSRSKFEAFIALFGFYQGQPPVAAVFIGLKIVSSSQVCFSFVCASVFSETYCTKFELFF